MVNCYNAFTFAATKLYKNLVKNNQIVVYYYMSETKAKNLKGTTVGMRATMAQRQAIKAKAESLKMTQTALIVKAVAAYNGETKQPGVECHTGVTEA